MISPTISIIIPVYNTGKYLRTCLDSIVNQTWQHTEIICVNDGSTDDSGTILKEYAQHHSHIIVIEQSNQGLSASRNNALDRAKGKYIAFVDSDDWLRLDALETLVRKAETSHADMLMFQADLYDEKTRETRLYDYTNYSALLPHDFPVDHFNYQTFSDNWHLLWQLPVMVCTVLWKRDFIERLHLRFPPRLSFEDNLFFKKALLQAETIAILKHSFYYYRQRTDSITNDRSRHFNDLCTIIGLEAEFVFKHLHDQSLKSNYLYHGALGHLYWAFWHTPHRDKKNIYIAFKETYLSLLDHCPEHHFQNSLPPAFKELPDILRQAADYESFLQSYSRSADAIAEQLQQLDSFYYKPNPGNVGDALIAVSTLGLFEKHGLRFQPYSNLEEGITAYDLVYGGGGACIPDWGALPWLINLFTDPRIRRCVILPQSFHDCLPLLHVLDERFTVFCRDKESFFYCKTNNHKTRFLLADDMAISLDVQAFLAQNVKQPTFDDLCLKQRVKNALSTLPDGRKVLLFIREDRESAIAKTQSIINSYETLDLSALNSDECEDFSSNASFVQRFLSSIDEADIVLTDRLHGAIGSLLMNKEVYMLDNSYGKLSGVYRHSLNHQTNVHLLNHPNEFPYWEQMERTKYPFEQSIVPMDIMQTSATSYLMGARFIAPTGNFNVHAEICHVEQKEDIELNGNPWIRMLIFHMMATGGTFHIKGTVSRSLLENMEQMIEYWIDISPGIFHPVTIVPDNIEEDDSCAVQHRKAIVHFSGGLDAQFATYRHTKGLAGYRNLNIQAGLMIAGVDIPLSREEFQQECFEQTVNLLHDLGISQTHLIKTNFRDMPVKGIPHGMEWDTLTHISCITSCASFLSQKYSDCLIGGSYPYHIAISDAHDLMRWGSNPISASLLTSRNFRIQTDGLQYDSTSKAALITQWQAGIQALRVCWKNEKGQTNCGHCEECIRTQLNFLACGTECPNMPTLTPEMLEQIRPEIIDHASFHLDIIHAAKQRGKGGLWWVLQLENILAEHDFRQQQTQSIRFMQENMQKAETLSAFKKLTDTFIETNPELKQHLITTLNKDLQQESIKKDILESYLTQNNLFIENKASKRIKKLNRIVGILSKFIIFPKARRKFRDRYRFKF